MDDDFVQEWKEPSKGYNMNRALKGVVFKETNGIEFLMTVCQTKTLSPLIKLRTLMIGDGKNK